MSMPLTSVVKPLDSVPPLQKLRAAKHCDCTAVRIILGYTNNVFVQIDILETLRLQVGDRLFSFVHFESPTPSGKCL